MEDLHKLNVEDVINLLKKVNALFPNGKPSKDIDERNEVIDSWDGEYEDIFETIDEQFYELESELESKLEIFVRRIIKK